LGIRSYIAAVALMPAPAVNAHAAGRIGVVTALADAEAEVLTPEVIRQRLSV
jgi:hypothetical protein